MRFLRLVLFSTLALMLPGSSHAQAMDHEVAERRAHANRLEELGSTADVREACPIRLSRAASVRPTVARSEGAS